jgi:hypothetical protein
MGFVYLLQSESTGRCAQLTGYRILESRRIENVCHTGGVVDFGWTMQGEDVIVDLRLLLLTYLLTRSTRAARTNFLQPFVCGLGMTAGNGSSYEQQIA